MCNSLTTKGVKCRLEPNKNYCFIHINKLVSHTKNEVKNLNNTIQKKNVVILNQKNEIKNLNNTVKKKNIIILNQKNQLKTVLINNLEMKEEITNLKEEILSMTDDFNNYQFIKKFELIKYTLKKKYDVNIKNCNEIEFFCIKRNNASILEELMGHQENYYEYYNSMRQKRNKLSHWYY